MACCESNRPCTPVKLQQVIRDWNYIIDNGDTFVVTTPEQKVRPVYNAEIVLSVADVNNIGDDLFIDVSTILGYDPVTNTSKFNLINAVAVSHWNRIYPAISNNNNPTKYIAFNIYLPVYNPVRIIVTYC